MTIASSLRQTTPLRADLLAATPVLAHIASPGPQLNHSASINNAALDCIYLLSPRPSTQQPISSTRRHSDRAAPRAKSP